MNDLKNIIKIIKDNGGCNLTKNLSIDNIKNGYMASYKDYEVIIDDINNDGAIYNAIQQKIKQLDAIKQKEKGARVTIGAWYNDNKLYLDISKNFNNKRRALHFAKNNLQRAIYDIKNGCDIDILCDVFILYKYNKHNNDFRYIKEYTQKLDILKDLQTSARALDYATITSVDQFTEKKLLCNNYVIIKDVAHYCDVNA